jgi:hypothetical protein
LNISRVIKNDSFFLILVGIANMYMGLIALLMYFTTLSNLQWLHDCLINMLVGFLLLLSAYFPLK